MKHLFPGNPLEHLDAYRQLHRVVVPGRRGALGDERRSGAARVGRAQWSAILSRNVTWKMACERTINFHTSAAERTTIFSEPELVEQRLRGVVAARSCGKFRCGSTWPGTITGPAAAARPAARTFLLNPADGIGAGTQRRRAVPLAADEFRHLPRLLERPPPRRADPAGPQFAPGRRGRHEDEYVAWGELASLPVLSEFVSDFESKYGQAGSLTHEGERRLLVYEPPASRGRSSERVTWRFQRPPASRRRLVRST